jgi:type IV secretory pathway TraG/TraD family ATPase VirD4
LKYIFRKIIMQKREAKLKKETEVLPTEENTANESFKAAVLQRMNQKSKNQVNRNYRRNLFTPDSALNTLPSMQIAMVVPNENAVDGTKRYNNQARIRSQLERTRMRSTTGTKFAKSPQYIKKTAKLNISLSSQFDHNRDSPILQNQELNKYAHANIVEKHTVYANRVRSNGSNRVSCGA